MLAYPRPWRCFKTYIQIGIATAAATTAAASAQTLPASNANRRVNLNYVYAADLGFGGYSLSGLTADVYTLPLAETLPDLPYQGWGLKLMLPIQGGIYNFRATDVDGRRIAIDQQSVSIVPGVELQVPIGSRTMLKPFAQFGDAHGFGSGVGNPNSWIYIAGARALTQWHMGDYTLSLGNALIYAGDSTIGPGFSEHYVSLQLGGEVPSAWIQNRRCCSGHRDLCRGLLLPDAAGIFPLPEAGAACREPGGDRLFDRVGYTVSVTLAVKPTDRRGVCIRRRPRCLAHQLRVPILVLGRSNPGQSWRPPCWLQRRLAWRVRYQQICRPRRCNMNFT